MRVNECGEAVECFAHTTKRGRSACGILIGWYNESDTDRCKNCPFFKTRERYRAELEKYPPVTKISKPKGE